MSSIVGWASTSQAAKAELVNLAKGIWILPVVLNYIDVVGGCKETCEGGGLRVPQRSRDNSYINLLVSRCLFGAITRTVLEEDVEALLDKEFMIQDDESEGHREDIVACALSKEVSNSFL